MAHLRPGTSIPLVIVLFTTRCGGRRLRSDRVRRDETRLTEPSPLLGSRPFQIQPPLIAAATLVTQVWTPSLMDPSVAADAGLSADLLCGAMLSLSRSGDPRKGDGGRHVPAVAGLVLCRSSCRESACLIVARVSQSMEVDLDRSHADRAACL